jgi:uncharacterized protein YqeY
LNNGEVIGIRQALRSALSDALKARDKTAMAALRSAIAAIDNAESVPVGERRAGAIELAGTLGAAEVPRKVLTEDDIRMIVQCEVSDRRAAAQQYQEAGRMDHAERLRNESDVLDRFLPLR